jgi:hypothetical protein
VHQAGTAWDTTLVAFKVRRTQSLWGSKTLVPPRGLRVFEAAGFGSDPHADQHDGVPLENSVSSGGLVFRCGIVELLVLRHENQVLRRQAGGRPRWDHTDRLWLTALSRLVNRCWWAKIFPVTAATILRWHRNLIARKWTFT